ATLPNGFLGAPAAATNVTLTFTFPQGGGAVLAVTITTVLSNWQFSTGYPVMVGGAFDYLQFNQPSFIFSSTPIAYAPPVTAADTCMSFSGALQLSSYAQAVLTLANLTGAQIPNPLIMAGPVSLDVADGVTVLYPIMQLVAPLSAQTFKILIFN